jgi:hypothetical protein
MGPLRPNRPVNISVPVENFKEQPPEGKLQTPSPEVEVPGHELHQFLQWKYFASE